MCGSRITHNRQQTQKKQGRVRFPNPKDRAKTMSLPEASSFSEWMGGVSRQQNNEEIIKNNKKTTNGLVFAHSQREKEKKVKRANATIDTKQHTRVTLILSFPPFGFPSSFLKLIWMTPVRKEKGKTPIDKQ